MLNLPNGPILVSDIYRFYMYIYTCMLGISLDSLSVI